MITNKFAEYIPLKIYITKPLHSRYGTIKLENPFKNIDDLIENCTIWFKKPSFEKPFMDIFGEGFVIRGWACDYSKIPYKDFPDCDVKKGIYEIIKTSISDNFHETIHNRHYRWIGELEVELVRKNTEGNLTLFLTKPSVWDIQVAGIDRAKIWFSKPSIQLYDKNQYTDEDYFYLCAKNYIEGKYFRKTKEHKLLLDDMWQSIKDTFTVSSENFLSEITEYNHKPGQDHDHFIKEYYFDIIKKGA